MRFRLRTLLLAMIAFATLFAGLGFLKREWFDKGDVSRAANQRFEALFAKRGWKGYATTFFYEDRVLIKSPDISDDELRELYPILQDIGWMHDIEIFDTRVTPVGIAELHRRFPDCHISQE